MNENKFNEIAGSLKRGNCKLFLADSPKICSFFNPVECALSLSQNAADIVGLYSISMRPIFENKMLYWPEELKFETVRSFALPPLEAVFTCGNLEVADWLNEIGWGVCAEFNDNFPAIEVVKKYYELWQRQNAMYSKEICIELGGWNFPWPEENWGTRDINSYLGLINSLDEPFVELWFKNDDIEFIARHT